jgi:hypothetical protein
MSLSLALAGSLLTVAGMASCVWLFVLLKGDLHRRDRRSRNRDKEFENALNAVRVSLANLGKRLEQSERQTGLLVPPPPTRSGFNLSKRSQAIRMSRRGETPSQIAAALELPQGEVDLLLKVHRIVVSLPAATATSKGGKTEFK